MIKAEVNKIETRKQKDELKKWFFEKINSAYL